MPSKGLKLGFSVGFVMTFVATMLALLFTPFEPLLPVLVPAEHVLRPVAGLFQNWPGIVNMLVAGVINGLIYGMVAGVIDLALAVRIKKTGVRS